MKNIFESRAILGVLCAIGFIIIALLIFSAGVAVGFHKASFGRAWGENYERNFGLRAGRPPFTGDNFPNANGATGRIIKIDLPVITIQDRDGTEKSVLLASDTQIQEMRNTIAPSDLKVNDFAVVIGIPNAQGQIEAKFIRIMPMGMPVTPPQTGTQAPTNI